MKKNVPDERKTKAILELICALDGRIVKVEDAGDGLVMIYAKVYEYTKENPLWTAFVSLHKKESGTETPLVGTFELCERLPDGTVKVLETGTTDADGNLAFTRRIVYTDGVCNKSSYFIRESVAPVLYPELLAAMESYNQQIWEEKQSGLCDPWAYEQPSFKLGDYGLEDEVFGVISIPRLELEMPIYLGATYKHMADGAAHLSQTSLPIGGENTNCVIAGHRGWGGACAGEYTERKVYRRKIF